MTKTPDPAPKAIGTGPGSDKGEHGQFDLYSPKAPSQQLRHAVQAAVDAYAQSGRMRDAALAYAAHGLPIFPLGISSKKPIPRRDPDPSGKHKKGIPGTGSFYKATIDPLIIRDWWQKNPEALIGLPMGERTGVFAIDVDTAEDHADGVAAWNKIVAQHERSRRVKEPRRGGGHHYVRIIPAFTTREHRSATGGPHIIFKWHAEQAIGCSNGALPDGISVKGQGGYIVAPPSRRKGRAYSVYRDIDPTDAPAWLSKLILPTQTSSRNYSAREVATDLDELADMMQFVPNNDLSWDDWTAVGLALFAASGGQAFDLFDAFSQKSRKYNSDITCDRWDEITGSPPNRTGVGKLRKIALANGWVPKLYPAKPTYAAPTFTTSDAARSETRTLVRDFLHYSVACPKHVPKQWRVWADYLAWCRAEGELDPDVQAMKVPTGIGKTQIGIEEIAQWIRDVTTEGPVIVAVPRHKLGSKIEQQFLARGINAKVFRGRNADDPEIPNHAMCHNLAAVELALKCHGDVSRDCCKQKNRQCRFFGQCGYQRQMRGAKPDVWIVAGDMLFHTHKVFGTPVAVITDEALWVKGLRGIEQDVEWSIAVDSLITNNTQNSGVAFDRNWLGEALKKQQDDGGVNRAQLVAALFPNGEASWMPLIISREWACLPKTMQHPGMSPAAIKTLARSSVVDTIAHTRRAIKIWEAVRDLILNPDITTSGRLTLKQQNGQRVISWKGVAEISKQFLVPTLQMDATLPSKEILQVYHPQVQIVGDIDVGMPPFVHIRQILRSPTSSTKLNDEKHLDEVYRFILNRWIETDCAPTLVICQMKVEKVWRQRGMPDNVTIMHYNDIAGIDDFKDVRLLILIGRTAPGPRAMEDIAGALFRQAPIAAGESDKGFVWYDSIQRGIRLPDGSGIAAKGDVHPDPRVEAIRWQIHEGELIQALGRGRGVNRTAETPLDVDLLVDSVLPITANEVVTWKKPSLLVETAKDGVMLASASDLVRLWPTIWPNRSAADRTLQEGVPELPGFIQVTYQLAGPKMKQRIGYFDLAVIPDPHAWLEAKLGPLV